MKKTFEELWYGKISPCTDYRKNSEQTKKLLAEFLKHYENLFASLNDEQKKLFEKYDECNLEIIEADEKEIFEYAFSPGARLIIEMLH